ncbi:MAG TPA: sugar ABC transporter substrate-binding protein [Solirubrobacteraceae bacterium]|jgi:ABC-type sugar transport system substrate-binding protein
MSRDEHDHPNPIDGSPPQEFLAGILDESVGRSDFFKGAGKLAAGTLGLGGLSALLAACGSSSASSSSAATSAAGGASSSSSAAASNKVKTIGVIEQAFAPFFTENFEQPLQKYLATATGTIATTTTAPAGWNHQFGNENNSVPTGISLLDQYAAQNYGGLILSTGDEMTAWEHAVQQATASGSLFINHSTQAVSGATQNTLFSHKGAGVGIGNAAIAWAHKNNITAPVVALIGNLTDAQGSKRTTWAWKTIKAAFPNAKLAGQVQGIDLPTGTTGAANLLSAHPDINVLIVFNTIAGVGAANSATHAGKTDRNKFYLGITDFENQTLNMIAAGNSIVQSNWGTFFPASMVLMARDIINKFNGHPMKPTRLLLGEAIVTPAQATSFNKIAFDPLNPKYADVYTKYFTYLDTPMKTGQVPPGQ